MYRRILALTEELEAALAGDQPADHRQLEALRARRATAFAALAAQDQPVASSDGLEEMKLIEQIQAAEGRCREQARHRQAALQRDLAGIRRGRRVQAAYGRFAGGV